MADYLLQKFFEPERWTQALEKAVHVKEINKADMKRLENPDVRINLYHAIKTNKYRISPPRQQKIPKDNGEFRIVYINENVDRVFLGIANDLLFELCPDMVDKSCYSYQKRIGTGKAVTQVANNIHSHSKQAWKSDLSKYFDTVPIRLIDECFDDVESKIGKSVIIDILREYYHQDWCFDVNGNLVQHYQSLKQGCAVASFLADALLRDIDRRLSTLNGYYIRYSDDMLFVGKDYKRAMSILKRELANKGMSLNPKKVEYLNNNKYFKFLGFSIKEDNISLSKKRLKTFQQEIESRTVRSKNDYETALNEVYKYLYKGDYPWAKAMLGIINVDEDITELNGYVMDCLRATITGRKKVGNLYYNPYGKGVVGRSKGRNVSENSIKIPRLKGYETLGCMRTALQTSVEAYDAKVLAM